MKAGYDDFRAKLLDKPDIDLVPYCAICGRPARDRHHIIQKGMGGVSREVEKRIPKIRVCGEGNASGCHGLLHSKRLHVYWDDYEEYVYLVTREPMDDLTCWELNRASYLPVPGWIEQKQMKRAEAHIFGSGKVRG